MFFKHSFNIADGSRLLEVENDRLWLVYGGKRHHLLCEKVFESLFVTEVAITRTSHSVLSEIAEGQDLMFGTSLVRRENAVVVHLLAVHPKGAILHPIPTKATADRCGFDIDLCRSLPAKTFDLIKSGAALS